MPADDRFSQRAHEVAEDLLSALDQELRDDGRAGFVVQFHLEASSVILDRAEAERWIKESVDEGHSAVRYYVEERAPGRVLVNLAAFEDPDSQFYP